MSNKKWSISCLMLMVSLLLILGGLTAAIDPFFHYHAPLKGLAYPLDENFERYQNDGIVKHFEYDAIITGTSMTENFKTSELDSLFGVKSVKVPFSGGSYKELNENLIRATAANPQIKYIIRGLDYGSLLADKDYTRYTSFPTFLYDNNFLNDTSYLLNKSIFITNTLEVLSYTRNGGVTTSFDDYANWADMVTYGKEGVNKQYARSSKKLTGIQTYTEADETILRNNLSQNVISLVKSNPHIEFYFFFTPYSIYYWDNLYLSGLIERQLTAEKQAIETLIVYENVNLFSFFDEFNLITDLNNYKDERHYSGDVNSQILEWMASGEHQLTQENYEEYCEKVWDFYTSYNYDDLFT